MLARGQSYRNFQVVSNFLVIFIAIFTVQNAVFFTFHPSPTQIATFQCVLMTDGTSSFVKFLYADGEMQWTKEDASGSTNGFGGTPAQVGFNAGDGKRFFSVPGSLTNRIMNIDFTTNVNIPVYGHFKSTVILHDALTLRTWKIVSLYIHKSHKTFSM